MNEIERARQLIEESQKLRRLLSELAEELRCERLKSERFRREIELERKKRTLLSLSKSKQF